MDVEATDAEVELTMVVGLQLDVDLLDVDLLVVVLSEDVLQSSVVVALVLVELDLLVHESIDTDILVVSDQMLDFNEDWDEELSIR